jgi:hypothetical protein
MRCQECTLRPANYEVMLPTGRRVRVCWYHKTGYENFVPGCTFIRISDARRNPIKKRRPRRSAGRRGTQRGRGH